MMAFLRSDVINRELIEKVLRKTEVRLFNELNALHSIDIYKINTR
jgi:hypothetical protein